MFQYNNQQSMCFCEIKTSIYCMYQINDVKNIVLLYYVIYVKESAWIHCNSYGCKFVVVKKIAAILVHMPCMNFC